MSSEKQELAKSALERIAYVFARIASNCENLSSDSADFKNLHNEVTQTLEAIKVEEEKEASAAQVVTEPEPDKTQVEVLKQISELREDMQALELHLAVISEAVTVVPEPEPEPEPEPTPEPAQEPAV